MLRELGRVELRDGLILFHRIVDVDQHLGDRSRKLTADGDLVGRRKIACRGDDELDVAAYDVLGFENRLVFMTVAAAELPVEQGARDQHQRDNTKLPQRMGRPRAADDVGKFFVRALCLHELKIEKTEEAS